MIITDTLSYGGKTVRMQRVYVGLAVTPVEFYAYESASATQKTKITVNRPLALVVSLDSPPQTDLWASIGYVLRGNWD